MGRRLLKVNDALREVLSAAIGYETKDPRIGFVTVTGVEATPDLRHAKVFVSVLGNKHVRARTLAGLASSQGFLQSTISSKLRMKRTPQLEFVYDETTDRAMRMEKLLTRYEGELSEFTVDGYDPDGEEVETDEVDEG